MVEKLVIVNKTKYPVGIILPHIVEIMNLGRISNNNTSYCYEVRTSIGFGISLTIRAHTTKTSDTFVVTEE